MGRLEKVGYEFRGWRLGERVRCKDDGKEYTIIGFNELDGGRGNCPIAIDRKTVFHPVSIKNSLVVTVYIGTYKNGYEWVEESEIEKIEENNNEVLKLEYQEVFGKVACRIVYQNENVLKRGDFEDEDLKVFSAVSPDFMGNKLYLRGIDYKEDENIFVVDKCDSKNIKEKVKKINEKYGTKQRWRAKNHKQYLFITSNLEITPELELGDESDNQRYNVGNYFKTREQAEEVLNRFKKVLSDYQE